MYASRTPVPKSPRSRRLLAWLALVLTALASSLLPVPAKAASPLPADLSPGYRFLNFLPLPSLPVQAVYDPGLKQVVTEDVAGNLSVIPMASGSSALSASATFSLNNPGNIGPDLVDAPSIPAVFDLDPSTGAVYRLNLQSTPQQDTISAIVTDPNQPQYLAVGPRGQTLYLEDASSLSWTGVNGGPLHTIVLPDPPTAPAAVYAFGDATVLFIPSSLAVGSVVMKVTVHPATGTATVTTLPDPGIAAGAAIDGAGTLWVENAPGGPYPAGALVAVPNAVYASTISGSAAAPPSGYDTGNLAGTLALTPQGVWILGQAFQGGPTLLVYGAATGTFIAYPSLPAAGPLIQNPILVLPTGHRSLVLADGAPPAAVSITGEALQPLTASSAELGVSPSGATLAVPMQSGVGWIAPSQSSSPLQSTAATAGTPTGAVAMTANGTAVGLAAAIQWFASDGTASPPTATYANATPLAMAPVSGGIATLLSNGAVAWPNGTLSSLPSGMVSLAAVPSGALAVGNGSMVGVSPNSPSPWLALSNPGFVGPLATTPDGGYALTSDGQSNTLQLVSLNPAAELGPIPLDPLSLPSGQSTGSIEGLALSPNGSTLYALTANGIALFQGPTLALSASPSTAAVGSQVVLTATLTTSQGQPAAGVPVTFSTGATVTTNTGGQASTTATLNASGPTLFTASAPGAVAQVTVTATAPPPPPAPLSGGGGGSGGGEPSSGAQGSPSPPPQWTVVVTPPKKLGPNPPPLSLQQPDRLPAPLPQGTPQYLFAVSSGALRYYPGRYHLLVEAPPGYLHPFSLWYYSSNFGQWFPLLPTRVGPGRFEAMAPFLTQFAISDAPYPTALTLTGSRAERSAAVAEATFPLGATAAILANQGYGGASPPDALVATPLAAYLKAPVLLTPSSSLPVALRQLLERLHVQEVYIVGGPRAVSPAIRSWLAEQGYVVKALFDGVDRYATAALVARYLQTHAGDGAPWTRVYLANGADVGASAPLSALAFTPEAGPILYTGPQGLPTSTLSALSEDPSEVVEAAPASDFAHTQLPSPLLARLHTLLAGGEDLAAQVDQKLTELGAFWVTAWHQAADAVLAGLYERLYRVPMKSPGSASASAWLWHIVL